MHFYFLHHSPKLKSSANNKTTPSSNKLPPAYSFSLTTATWLPVTVTDDIIVGRGMLNIALSFYSLDRPSSFFPLRGTSIHILASWGGGGAITLARQPLFSWGLGLHCSDWLLCVLADAIPTMTSLQREVFHVHFDWAHNGAPDGIFRIMSLQGLYPSNSSLIVFFFCVFLAENALANCLRFTENCF